jgi:anti-sigma regulatory factor (Ser/Thr protein kinase)
MSEAVRQVLPADAVAPSLARHRIRSWLTSLHWPPAAADDLVLAISEAVSNTVEHAYPRDRGGDVVVEADCVQRSDGGRQVVVTVRDSGAWHAPPAWHENRGRGLPLMRACTESMEIEGGPGGTQVRLVSKPV